VPLVFYNKVLGFGKRKAVIKMQDKENAIDHLKSHQKYPATKAQLVAECNNLSDFSEEDKKEFKEIQIYHCLRRRKHCKKIYFFP